MEKHTLVESASQLKKVSKDSLKQYVDKLDLLDTKMNEVMIKRKDILELIGGEKNITMMKDNHRNHLRFIASILQEPNPEALVDTVLWVFREYMSRGFSTDYWVVQLDTWTQLLKENISENAFSEIFSIYNWMSVNISYFSISTDENLEKSKHADH